VPLTLGKVCAGRLECAYHEWKFAGDGRCVEIPALPPGQHIPPNARASALPVIERGGAVWVWPGDPKLADAAKIPLPTDLADGMIHAHTITAHFPVRFHFLMEHVLDAPHFYNLHQSTILRLLRQRDAGTGLMFEVEDRGDELTMEVRAKPGGPTVLYRVFDPCHLEVRAALSARLGYRFFFIHTPVDETHTTGTMFQYRSFLRRPGLRQGFNWVFERLTRKAIAEDGELMRAQMENAARGARSTAAYYFDTAIARYYKWQKRREPDDLWFRGFDHERARHGERGGVHLPIAPPDRAPSSTS
jgi:phenylpropionate dioxygenase-like ring-hydroxylating dioxygenase large terminal subunit